MRSNTVNRMHALVILGTVAALAVVALTRSGAGVPLADGYDRAYLLPTSRILERGQSVVKLDTRTGAMYIMRGDATAKGSGNQWARRVKPVGGTTSGMLDIQRAAPEAGGAMYLVDVLGDRTWILKWRGTERGEWVEIGDAP